MRGPYYWWIGLSAAGIEILAEVPLLSCAR